MSLPLEEKRARKRLLELAPIEGVGERWDTIWPILLSNCAIRLKELKQIANEYRKQGISEFPTWPPGNKRRTPDDKFLVRRGKTNLSNFETVYGGVLAKYWAGLRP